MKRGQKTSAEQVVLMLRQIEVQTAQGKSLALACKEAEISEQSYRDVCLRQEIFYSSREAQIVIGLWQNTYNRVRPHSSPGLPAARACQLPRSGLPATHGCCLAVDSHSARSRIPVRWLSTSFDREP
jgi:putative transposase